MGVNSCYSYRCSFQATPVFNPLKFRLISRYVHDVYMKDGLHLSGKGAAVFAEGLAAAVDSDMGIKLEAQGGR